MTVYIDELGYEPGVKPIDPTDIPNYDCKKRCESCNYKDENCIYGLYQKCIGCNEYHHQYDLLKDISGALWCGDCISESFS